MGYNSIYKTPIASMGLVYLPTLIPIKKTTIMQVKIPGTHGIPFPWNGWYGTGKKTRPIFILGGGFKYVLFLLLFGEDSHFD